MKAFCCATLVLTLAALAAAAVSDDQCSYSVHSSCAAAGSKVRSNSLLSSLKSIKLSDKVKDVDTNGKLKYGSTSESADTYAQALCPCECSRCPKPLKAQNEAGEVDDNKCLCACGTCGKTPSKNKLPAVVPLDCNLKCEVISEVQTQPQSGYTGAAPSYGSTKGTTTKGTIGEGYGVEEEEDEDEEEEEPYDSK